MESSQQQVQPQIVIASPINASANADAFQRGAQRQMRVLSILQIVMGCLSMVFGIAVVALWFGAEGIVGTGIWSGAYFVVVGGISLKASSANTKNWITASMVLNIISTSLFCSVAVGFSAASIASTSRYYRWYGSLLRGSLALDSLLLITAVAQFVTTIWSAVLCCGAVCRCCKPQAGTLVTYNQQPQMLVSQGSTALQGQPMAQPVQYMHPVGVHQQPAMYMVQPQPPPSY